METPTESNFSFEALHERIRRQVYRDWRALLSRRDFLKLSGLGLASLPLLGKFGRSAAQTAAEAATAPTLPNGVASGDVTQTTAVLWTRSTEPGDVLFELSESASFEAVAASYTTAVSDPMLPVKAQVSGLLPGTQYWYRMTDAAGSTLTGQFRTAADVYGGSVGLRFGVSGDWRGELRPYPALANAAGRELDFFVLHGDTVYADIPSLDITKEQAETLEEFRAKHNEVYSERFGVNYFAHLRAMVPVMATIDDHEVTNDFAGGAAPETDERFAGEDVEYINQTSLYRNGLQSFQEYNPLRDEFYTDTNDPRMEGRPRLYRYQTYGTDAAVFVLDARSFRDAPVEATEDILNLAEIRAFNERMWTEDRTMLGRTQVEDLKRHLLDAENQGITWKFILMPEPVQQMGWFGGNDRWEGYAPERTEVLQFIEANEVRNVVFIAADVHSTFINNLTYQTEPNGALTKIPALEVTTGPVAFWPPTGAALAEGARDFGLVNDERYAEYQAADIAGKDTILGDLFNRVVLVLQRYNTLGIEAESGVEAELLVGGWIAGHVYGWAEFDVEAETQALTVTTWGVPAYSPEQMAADPQTYLSVEPQIISQFRVMPAR